MTFEARARAAIADADLTIKELARRLRDAGVSPNSYPTVHGYVSGAQSPSVSWVEAAAAILNVEPAWLAFGVGAAARMRTVPPDRVLAAMEAVRKVLEEER